MRELINRKEGEPVNDAYLGAHERCEVPGEMMANFYLRVFKPESQRCVFDALHNVAYSMDACLASRLEATVFSLQNARPRSLKEATSKINGIPSFGLRLRKVNRRIGHERLAGGRHEKERLEFLVSKAAQKSGRTFGLLPGATYLFSARMISAPVIL